MPTHTTQSKPAADVPIPPERVGTSTALGQATAIEQSRVIAEVQAQVIVAQQCPRDIAAAVIQIRESCAQQALAERAFFRYSRGGTQITGPSIHMARELARCWGNIQYGISELRRDDAEGISEMQAFAWDVQTNTRSASIFIVPHKRDRTGGPVALTDLRDIYENNANQGARRVREAIFAVLPPWLIEDAKARCMATLEAGGNKPLAQRVADAVDWFAVQFGVSLGQLEAKVGAKRAQWEALDVARLEVIARSLRTGEASRDEEFPAPSASASDYLRPAPREAEQKDAEPARPPADGIPIEDPPTDSGYVQPPEGAPPMRDFEHEEEMTP